MSSYSLYDASILTAKSVFKTMDHILLEAEKHPNAATFPTARLIEDMKPLTFQIHIAAKLTDQMVARLTDHEVANFEDNLSTYADMHERIEAILKVLDAADKDVVLQRANDVKATSIGPLSADMTGTVYATAFAMPNVYFHLMTAYSILRKEGVPIGKRDFLSEFLKPHLSLGAGASGQ